MSTDLKKKDNESTDNNELARKWERSEITLAGYAAQRHVPLGGTFELTPRCNLRCKMCYIRLDKHQMDLIGRERTADEWIGMAREAAAAGTLNLLITGGGTPVQARAYGFDLPPKIITCLAAKSMYWITWDGKMLPCGSFARPFTLPFAEGFRQAWDRLPTLFEDI